MRHYILITKTQDGEHEYLDRQLFAFDGDPTDDKAVLSDFFMEPVTHDEWCGGYQVDGDYRIYHVYSIKEIDPNHLNIIRTYL
jgi:hypothetical protein